MITYPPPLSLDEALTARTEPGQFLAEPHVWMLPRRPTPIELDTDRIIATYQRSAIVRTFERHKLTMDAVDELDALLEAYLSKAQRYR